MGTALNKHEITELHDLAGQKGQNGINAFKGNNRGAELLKNASWATYLNVQRVYAQTHYGAYSFALAVTVATGTYAFALLAAPTLIPFGLAVITTAWLKYTLAAVFASAALFFGYAVGGATLQEINKLYGRFENKRLSNSDLALLGTIAVAGVTTVGMMYALPSMLPLIGSLTGWVKHGTAAAIATVSAVAGYAAFFGRPATPPAPKAPVTSATKGKGEDEVPRTRGMALGSCDEANS